MSETKSQTGSKDVFSTYQQNMDKLFSSARQYIPQYHQSITNIQQEYIQTFEGVLNSAISTQKEFAKKSGITTNQTDYTAKTMRDTNEDLVKITSIQNQLALAALDTTQQNIKTFASSAKLYSELNRNILRSWLSAFTAKSN